MHVLCINNLILGLDQHSGKLIETKSIDKMCAFSILYVSMHTQNPSHALPLSTLRWTLYYKIIMDESH